MTINHQPSTINQLSRYWLLLGVSALAVAGLFSLVLVVARTPQLANLPLFARLFHQALVVHVDLSVLVWFLSIACLMWSLLVQGSRPLIPYLEEAALVAFALGTAAITFSPLDPYGEALMSNYIPVLLSPLFFLGLGLLLCGVGLMLTHVILSIGRKAGVERASYHIKDPSTALRFAQNDIIKFAILSAAIIAAIAIAAFFLSYHQMPRIIDGQQYYELLFWGGGHVLQFVHVQMLMVCWLLLLSALSLRERGGVSQGEGGATGEHLNMLHRPHPDPLPGGEGILYILFSIGLLIALATPLPYLLYEVTSSGHRDFFTRTMTWAGALAPAILGLLILPDIGKKCTKNALCSSLLASILLFLYGGILGGMIQGQNVVIPAHYHGSIVGVTLGFMGAAYLFLPKFGWRDVSSWKLAFWQPIVYGGGQLLHISGLAWSGGYGVLRKTPGGMENLPLDVKAAMGFMGLGGVIAIIGGFMFVIVVARAVWPRRA